MRPFLLCRFAFAGLLLGGCTTAPAPQAAFPDPITGLGTEPFWSISLSGARFTYRDPESQRLATVTKHVQDDRLIVTGALDGEALRAVFTPGACSDGMSDRRYPYRLLVLIGTTTLRGCAASSRDAPQHRTGLEAR